MPAAKLVHTSDCPDCGSPLAGGVCPACALNFLLAPAVVPTVTAKGADLDMEFGRYLLKRKLASGGMGVVYVAEDSQLKRSVALKMIRGSTFANEAERTRFTVESEAVAGLDHPNIVPIHEVGMIEEQPFFTMKLINGRSLGERLREGATTRQIADWLSQIAKAVQHAHQRGVLHRDLKPGNILIDEEDHAWLMDFGLAKLQNEESGLTRSSDHLGTPHYMSPEVVNGGAGDVSTTSDVWSLGVILWEALSGKPPFAGSGAVEILRKIAEVEPERVESTIDRDLMTLAQRCLEKDPARRVATAGEFGEELDRWRRGEPLLVRRITTAERLFKWMRRKPALAALYLVLACGVVSSLMLWQRAETAVASLTQINDQLGQALAISTATALAMEARVQTSEDPALALLLAVEAVEQTERRSGGVLPGATESLFATLQRVGGRGASPTPERIEPQRSYDGHELSFQLPPLFSPDGRRLLTFDYTQYLVEGLIASVSDTHRSASEDASECRWQISPEIGRIKAMSWTEDSDGIVNLDSDGELQLWKISDEPVKIPMGNLNREGKQLIKVELKSTEGGRVDGIALYAGDGGEGIFFGHFQVSILNRGGLLPFDLRRLDAPVEAASTHFALAPDWRWCVTLQGRQLGLLSLREGGEWAPFPEVEDGFGATTFSEDGRWLAFRFGVDSTWIFDLRSDLPQEIVKTGRKLFQHDEWIQMMAFSPSGETLAVAGHSDEIFLLPTRVDGGEPRALRLRNSQFLGINFSPDGRWLAAGSYDKRVSIWPAEWDGAAPEPIELRGLPTQVLTVHFSPDSGSLVATGRNPAYWQWDLRNHERGAQPWQVARPQRAESIEEMAISPDKKWFAAACAKRGGVKLIAADGRGEWVIGKHEPSPTGVAFDPEGRWLASGGCDGKIKVWDLVSLTSAIGGAGVLPAPIHVLDVSDARIEYSRRVAFHPRGILYATCGDGLLFEWDLNEDRPGDNRQSHLIHSNEFMLPDVAVSPDGRWLGVGRYGTDAKPREGQTQFAGMVLLFDVSSPGPPVPVAELPASFRGRSNVDFSSDSRWLVGSGDGEPPNVWDLQSEDIAASRQSAPVSADGMAGVSFSPNGRTLALAGSDGQIHLWNWQTQRRATSISADGPIFSLGWLDDTRLASGGASGRIEVWETDVSKLKSLARRIAGRELSGVERGNFRIER